MWHHYHELRTTPRFSKKWADFIRACDSSEQAPPILFQCVTDAIFKLLIPLKFPVQQSSQASPYYQSAISSDEACVIRYAASYTLYSLKNKIERSLHPYKEELILAIMELINAKDSHSSASA